MRRRCSFFEFDNIELWNLLTVVDSIPPSVFTCVIGSVFAPTQLPTGASTAHHGKAFIALTRATYWADRQCRKDECV